MRPAPSAHSAEQGKPDSTESLRLFIAVELPDEVKQALRDLRAEIERHNLPVRWSDPDGTHLTLKFLGATAAAQLASIGSALTHVAARRRPFTLHTTDPGVFPSYRAPRVVWLGVGGMLAELNALQADVERLVAPLGFPTEQRAFNPHLTLGRTVKDARGIEIEAIGRAVRSAPSPRSRTWTVTKLSLMRSELRPQGARYTALEEYGLGGD